MPQKMITAKCCAQGSKFIYLSYTGQLYDHDTQTSYETMVTTTPPQWVVTARDITAGYAAVRETLVQACPFCSTALKPPRLRANHTKKYAVIIDGGYYCNRCARRLQACKCPLPEQCWRP